MFKDDMKQGDQPPKVELRCAVCNEFVSPGEEHKHEGGKKDETTDSSKEN